MAKAISTLAVGSKIGFSENGQIVLYEVAGFNVHAANSATLVRKDVHSVGVQFYPSTEGYPYDGGPLDAFMIDFENKYTVTHRANLITAAIVYADHAYSPNPSSGVTINRKVFALSYTEIGGGANNTVNENSALSLYSNDAARIKNYNGTAASWWLRSVVPDVSPSTPRFGCARRIYNTGITTSYNLKNNTGNGAVPAFVISSTLTVSDSINPVTGGYDIIFPDPVPSAPTLLSPVNVYAEIDAPITFSWQHIIDTGSAQTKADLQYSYENGAWVDFATVTGSGNSYTLSANSLAAGHYRWRARTYNTDSVAGAWSEPVAFVGIGAPAAPTISGVTSASRPAISWQSVGQVGYQFQLLHSGTVLYDTGETVGAEKILTLPLYLANGNYTVRLRIVNASQRWSNWAEYNFTLAVTPPSAPTVTASPITDGARISVSGIAGGVEHAYLLRNGIPVADITGLTQYDDYAALGTTEYVVRVVDGNENYADSLPATVTVSIVGAVLAAVDDMDNIVTMKQKSAGQPAVSRQKQYIGSAHNYAGREYPVYTFSEFATEMFNPSYYYTDLTEWARLEALTNRRRTVLYRDMVGNWFYGVVTTSNFAQDDDRVSFVLSIQRVDYVEQIDYAEVTEA